MDVQYLQCVLCFVQLVQPFLSRYTLASSRILTWSVIGRETFLWALRSVRWSVGRLVGPSICLFYFPKRGLKFHFHAPIGEIVKYWHLIRQSIMEKLLFSAYIQAEIVTFASYQALRNVEKSHEEVMCLFWKIWSGIYLLICSIPICNSLCMA